MFDNLKQLHQLKKMQEEFKKEEMTAEKNGVSITMNGNFEVKEIKLNKQLSFEQQEEVLKETINEAREKIQQKLAQNLKGSGLGM